MGRRLTVPAVPAAWWPRAGAAALAVLGASLPAAWAWPIGRPVPVPALPLDAWIPFWGPAVFVYASFVPYLVFAVWRLRDPVNASRVAVSMLLAQALALCVFVLHPTLIPRQDLSGLSPLVKAAFRLCYAVDDPKFHGTSFPSMHVGLAVLAAYGYRDERRSELPWMAGWAAAICVSTLLAKEHFVVDVAGGLALAVGVRRLVDTRLEFTLARGGSRRAAAAPAAGEPAA